MNWLDTLPSELMRYVIEFSEEKLKQWILISMTNHHWRSIFLSFLEPSPGNELYLKSLFTRVEIPVMGDNMTIYDFFRDNQYRGEHSIFLSSMYPIYGKVLGIDTWVSSLGVFELGSDCSVLYSSICSNDYSSSVYTYHEKIMKHFPQFSLEEKYSFLNTLLKFNRQSTHLRGAIALDVTPYSKIGFLYTYKRPKKNQRDLFIMTKKTGKKIYLNGLSSVMDSKRIRKNAILYHIKSKQYNWSKRLYYSGGYSHGMELIKLFKPHLLKCQLLLEKLASFKSRKKCPK